MDAHGLRDPRIFEKYIRRRIFGFLLIKKLNGKGLVADLPVLLCWKVDAFILLEA